MTVFRRSLTTAVPETSPARDAVSAAAIARPPASKRLAHRVRSLSEPTAQSGLDRSQTAMGERSLRERSPSHPLRAAGERTAEQEVNV